MTGYKTIFLSTIPCILIIFFGSWSDRHNRRKPAILLPLVGYSLMPLALLFCVYFKESPIELAIFFEVLFPSITGNLILICILRNM